MSDATVPATTPVTDTPDGEETAVPRDWRALIVACSGLGVVAVIAVVGFIAAPGSTPVDEVSTKGENIVAIATAAFTEAVTAAELAGAEPSQAGAAVDRATRQIRARGLHARR
jgi:hypothetical protein